MSVYVEVTTSAFSPGDLETEHFSRAAVFTCHFLLCKAGKRRVGTLAFVLLIFPQHPADFLSQRDAGERNGICLNGSLQI